MRKTLLWICKATILATVILPGCSQPKANSKPSEAWKPVTGCELLALGDTAAQQTTSSAEGAFLIVFGGYNARSETHMELSYLCYAKNLSTKAIKLKRLPAEQWDLMDTDSTPMLTCDRKDEYYWCALCGKWMQHSGTQWRRRLHVPEESIVRGIRLDLPLEDVE